MSLGTPEGRCVSALARVIPVQWSVREGESHRPEGGMISWCVSSAAISLRVSSETPSRLVSSESVSWFQSPPITAGLSAPFWYNPAKTNEQGHPLGTAGA